MLLVGFSGTLLVVSALDMVCDCHLGSLLRSWGGCWWFLWGIWVLVGLGVALSGLLWGGRGGGGVVGCVQGRELGARTSPSEVYPAGKLHWHFTCGLDFKHSLWLPFETAFAVLKELLVVPMGTMGLCQPGDNEWKVLLPLISDNFRGNRNSPVFHWNSYDIFIENYLNFD